jgi:DNA-binding NtrC family response regulator
MEAEKGELNLLLVDDEEDFLEATAQALEQRGFSVGVALDGRTALLALSAHAYDAVVLDVKMPGIDGVDVFRELKHLRPGVPVVMLTGHGSIQQAFETSREGVAEYLAKPCTIDKLARVVRRVVDRARREPDEVVEQQDDPRRIRLLLVDDEVDLLESLSDALEVRGIEVTTAPSGEAALRLMERQVFDVALVDVKLPGMDGLALLRRMKKLEPMLEEIVLTGHPSMGIAVEGFREGAVDILLKPQRPDVLADRIIEAARRRRRREEDRRRDQVERILERRGD